MKERHGVGLAFGGVKPPSSPPDFKVLVEVIGFEPIIFLPPENILALDDTSLEGRFKER